MSKNFPIFLIKKKDLQLKCLKKIISKKLGLLDSTFYDDKIELTQIGDQLAASKMGVLK